MRIAKRIAGHVWAVYVFLMFFLIACVCLPLLYLILKMSADEKKFFRGHRFVQYWASLYLIVFGMLWRVKGRQYLHAHLPAIIVSNHVSQFDILLNLVALPIPFRFLSKKEVANIPVIGYCVKHLHLLVDRSKADSRTESMKNMVGVIEAGTSVVIYPEGTRNGGPDFTRPFFDGAFRLAVKTGRPLIVVTLIDTWKRQNPHMWGQMLPGRMRVTIDPPIPTAGLTENDIPRLKTRVKELMESHLQPVYGEGYTI
jgi:1-acyl-sn-glycerol-3-phosphate acyltransferase